MGAEDTIAAGTLAVVHQFNDAVNQHDLAAVAAVIADDILFENTNPAPDGTRIEGKAAFLAWLGRWFAANPGATFETEDVFAAGDRCVVRWVYRKVRDGQPWHVRGVDVLTVTNGKLFAKRAYVKG
jgi:ketosteroid isomerase-like protein